MKVAHCRTWGAAPSYKLESGLESTSSESLCADSRFRGSSAIRQWELFHRAAGCEHQRRIVTNPGRRKAYSLLFDMWIELANGSVGMSDDQIAQEIATKPP
jgi:hypothetical protein